MLLCVGRLGAEGRKTPGRYLHAYELTLVHGKNGDVHHLRTHGYTLIRKSKDHEYMKTLPQGHLHGGSPPRNESHFGMAASCSRFLKDGTG